MKTIGTKGKKKVIISKYSDVFKTIREVKVLIQYEFPLLVTGIDSNNSRWIFKWCEEKKNVLHLETEVGKSDISTWMAFQISQKVFDEFIEGNLSLRELIFQSLSSNVTIYESEDVISPLTSTKSLSPYELPIDYLPMSDITVKGERWNPSSKGGLSIFFHIISDKIEKFGEVPWSLLPPFQESFQRYLNWASHYNLSTPNKGTNKRVLELIDPEPNWTTITTTKRTGGSIKLDCSVDETNTYKKIAVSQSLDDLRTLTNPGIDEVTFREIMGRINFSGILYYKELLVRISKLKLFANVNWVDHNGEEKWLILNPEIAKDTNENLSKFLSGNDIGNISITVVLTNKEADYLDKKANGQGGWQDLVRELQPRLDRTGDVNKLVLTPDQIERVFRYVNKYGSGGFEYRLAGVARAVKRLGISFLPMR